jgi:AraC-like DNA-binding protein
MKPTLDPWQLSSLLAAAQGFFLAFLLFFHQRGNRLANRFLGALIFVFSLRLLEIVAFWTKYLLVFPHFTGTTWALPILFGVLFYFYAKSLTGEGERFDKKTWLHFLPFLLYVISLIPYYRLSAGTKRYWLEHFVYSTNPDAPKMSLVRMAIYLLQFPLVLIYLLLAVKYLSKLSRSAKAAAPAINTMKFTWLRNLAIGFGGFWTLWLLYNLALAFGASYHRWLDYGVTYAMAMMIYMIGYAAFRQPELFSGDLFARNGPKYEKSTLTGEQADYYLGKLVSLMETEKLFLNSELTLPDLAQRLGISPNHLSQIINEKLKQNFFDFVNRYRVEAVKSKLADPAAQTLTMLGLALEAGFNNKTSFNLAFKKFTGTTPSQYRKHMAEGSQLKGAAEKSVVG